MTGFDGNGWAPASSQSAEDREKAIEVVARALRPSDFWNETAEYPTAAREDYGAGQVVARIEAQPVLDALIAAGWGPGGVSARPDREALARAIWYANVADLPFNEWSDRHPEQKAPIYKLADALLAVEHLWTQPAREPVCTCFVTPESMWFRYGSAVEPGSQLEPNPDCPVHFPVNASNHANVTPPVVEREELEAWSFEHRPVTSMKDGSIAGCQCMDRVFVKGVEDWDSHLADSLMNSGIVRSHAQVGAALDRVRVLIDGAVLQDGQDGTPEADVLVRAVEVQAAMEGTALRAERPSVPVVDPEALAQWLWRRERQRALEGIGLTEKDTPHVTWESTNQDSWRADAAALLASGVVQDRATVEAEALDAAAAAWPDAMSEFDGYADNYLRARANDTREQNR